MPASPEKPGSFSRRQVLSTTLLALLGTAGCSDSNDDGVGPDGVVVVDFWHGQTDTGKDAIDALINEFNRTHPLIRVEGGGGGVTPDSMLQKVTAGLASGSYPDIAYIFGSDLARISRSPKVADLTNAFQSTEGAPWTDFWMPARDAVTINGRISAAPALLDALCVVYNKKLFDAAREPYPKAGWTWDDFLAIAKRLTDSDRGVFGTGWPGVGDEDTVWRWWPMIWDLGGDVVSPDGRSAGFAATGEQALATLDRLRSDESAYVDPKPGGEQMYQVFLSNRMAMVATGPWQLPDIIDNEVEYGVVPLPTYSGKPMTIAGPDTWTVFDNGAARTRAATEFVHWLIQPARDIHWDIEAGSLPLSTGTAALPAWRKHAAETEGLQVFVDALNSARVRPTVTAYPEVSQYVGEAIVSVLLGRRSPAQALARCVERSNAILAVPS